MSTSPIDPQAAWQLQSMPATPRRRGTLIGITLLFLIALAGQSVGLRSLIQYGLERDGWLTQKQRQDQILSEWMELNSQLKAELDELKTSKSELMTENAKLSAEQKRLADELVPVKAQFEAISKARDEAVSLQQRAKQQEQTSLDAAQAAQLKADDLGKTNKEVAAAISNLKMEKDQLSQTVTTLQATVTSQKDAIAKQTQDLTELDTQLSKSKDGLRKVNADLVMASRDLESALKEKQDAKAAILDAIDNSERLTKIKDEFASVTGKVAALKTEKESLVAEIAKEETRIENAKKKLAAYLEQWNNRDLLTKEITTMQSDLAKLNGDKKALIESIAELTQKQKDAESAVLTKNKLASDTQGRIDELLKEETRLANALLERIKNSTPAKALDEEPKETPAPPLPEPPK